MARRKLMPFDISPTQIAEVCGVSQASISGLETKNMARYEIYKNAYLYLLEERL